MREVSYSHRTATGTGQGGTSRELAGPWACRRGVGRLLPLVIALAIASACDGSARSASTAASPTAVLTVPPSREPRDLAQLPQEDAVLRAFQAAGISIQGVGASKFADALGTPRPARVFIAAAGSRGADVLFLDAAPANLQMCASPSPPGYVRYTVSVNGQRASSGDSPEGKPAFYLVNSSFFVIAWDEATSAALQRGLGVSPARC